MSEDERNITTIIFKEGEKMFWYKVWAMYGGGHHGYGEQYFYRTKKLTPKERQQLWEDTWEHCNNATGKVQAVKSPPKSYVLDKIISTNRNITVHIPDKLEAAKRELKMWKSAIKKKKAEIKPNEFSEKRGNKIIGYYNHCKIYGGCSYNKGIHGYSPTPQDSPCDKCDKVITALKILEEK